MSQKRSALFFDVDDTLLGADHQLVESARLAILEARKNGHLCFINSGRCYSMLHEIEEMIPVDGLLCGCGTEVIVGGESKFLVEIPMEIQQRLVKADLKYHVGLILEGTNHILYREGKTEVPAVDEMREMSIRWGIVPLDVPFESEYNISKFCFQAIPKSDVAGMYDEFGKDFDIMDRGSGFYEAVPRGCSKGEIIKKISEMYDIDMENTYVFGDSSNDLAMFKVAKHCIAMKKHDPVLDEYATYVTDTPENDGIKKAMEHYGLI